MAQQNNTRFLKIVVDESKAQARRDLARWLIEGAPDPVPDNPRLVLALENCPGGLSAKDVRELIEDLVSEGRFDRIQIGSQQHLTRRARPVIGTHDDKERFRLEVAIDLENEKQLLYRIVIILELVTIGLFLRQWALDPAFVFSLF